MTAMTASTTAAARPSLVLRLLNGVWAFLISLAESGAIMDEVRRLNATSDEDLAARGLTREGEIRRIFGPRMGF